MRGRCMPHYRSASGPVAQCSALFEGPCYALLKAVVSPARLTTNLTFSGTVYFAFKFFQEAL